MPQEQPELAAPLARRIKRHLVGRDQRFFTVTAPGLEPLVQDELKSLSTAPHLSAATKGGLTFEGRLPSCYEANLRLRTAHRVLMRIAEFNAADFGTLEKRCAAVPWELYLHPGRPLKVSARTRRSKLYHTAAVVERVQSGILTRLAAGAVQAVRGSADRPPQEIAVRLVEDRCMLSIDSSGANLYKRGLKTRGGRAPLRETLAAAVLLLAGYDGRETLCDPMCGSGTFALEAALIAGRIPPGWFREFQFQQWPAFRESAWRHLRRLAAPPEDAPARGRIQASDLDAANVAVLEQALTQGGLRATTTVSREDFFTLEGQRLATSPGLLVLNPPYGRRLARPGEVEPLYRDIGRKLKSDFRHWRAAILLPQRRLERHLPLAARRFRLTHGGQPVWVLIGKVTP
jgi:putative N6-adenine-specific DNA methylase